MSFFLLHIVLQLLTSHTVEHLLIFATERVATVAMYTTNVTPTIHFSFENIHDNLSLLRRLYENLSRKSREIFDWERNFVWSP
jgi:hypothetical protein